MSIERFKSFESEESAEKTPLELKMEIQKTIIEHKCLPNDEMDECVENWLEVNAKNFANVFESESQDFEILLDEWQRNPGSVLDRFMEKLDQESGQSEFKRAA